MENKKTKEKEIIDIIDRAINELVYEKTQIIKAYNYYHGKRDPEQFRHLEENYGLGTPTSVEFIPLVRKHVDVLIGEYLSTPVQPRISCKDEKTLSNIFRDKQLAINNSIASELNSHLKNSIYAAIKGDPKDVTDSEMLKRLNELYEATDRNFISEYEIAGQNIVDWSMQSRVIDFANQRKILLTDLLVTGTAYYKVYPSPDKTNVRLKVLNPVNTFIDRNPEKILEEIDVNNRPLVKDNPTALIKIYNERIGLYKKYSDYIIENNNDYDYAINSVKSLIINL